MALGPRDTKDLVLLTGWDAGELEKFRLQDGTSYAQVAAQVAAGLGALSSELISSPLWSKLVSYTDEPVVEYRIGSSNGFERHTEYSRPDSRRADTEGHMLPLVPYDRQLGWTWDYLRKARTMQVEADVRDAIKDARDLFRQKILTRALKRGDDSGEGDGLGTGGYSPGWATAAASTNVDYTPPAHAGTTFTSDHEHYVGIAGGAFTTTVFSDAEAELLEHGHQGPYEFWISTADKATVEGLTGFVPVAESLVAYGSNTAVATFGEDRTMDGAYAIGTLNNFIIRVVPGMPQYYGLAFKSYGANSQRNPIRIRLPKGANSLSYQLITDPSRGPGAFPLQNVMVFTEFGVGTNDRSAATARYVNNATWADGSPS